MTTVTNIRDETRNRIAAVHGSTVGADVGLKAMNTIIRHIVAPSADSMTRLVHHLAVLDASKVLTASLPDDYQADHHWPLSDMPPSPQHPAPQPMAPPARMVTFEGKMYPVGDIAMVSLFAAIAGAAIQNGVQAGNLRWTGVDRDFALITHDGEAVPMDAPTVVAFALAVMRKL